MPSISRADRVMLVSLLAVAVVASLLTMMAAPPAREGSIVEQPSTFFNERYGTKAAYLALERLGYGVRRMRHPLDRESLEPAGMLFLLEPIEPLREYEERALLEWVSEGHVLVVSPGRREWQPKRSRRSGTLLDAWFHMRGEDTEIRAGLPQRVPATRGEELSASSSLFGGIEKLSARRGRRFEPGDVVAGPLSESRVREIWKDEQGTVLATIRHGRGRIIALADAFAISNGVIGNADHPALLANLVRLVQRQQPPGAIVFDEFHLGFEEHAAQWTAIVMLLWQGPWAGSILQAAFAGFLALWAAGVRFGKRSDVTIAARRHHGEFARAAGRLLHDAGAADVAYETLARHYRGQLCRRLHVDPAAPDAALESALPKDGAAEIVQALSTAAASRRRTTRGDVLRLARRMDQILRASKHGA